MPLFKIFRRFCSSRVYKFLNFSHIVTIFLRFCRKTKAQHFSPPIVMMNILPIRTKQFAGLLKHANDFMQICAIMARAKMQPPSAGRPLNATKFLPRLLSVCLLLLPQNTFLCFNAIYESLAFRQRRAIKKKLCRSKIATGRGG